MTKKRKHVLLIKRIHKDAELPSYHYESDIGLDLTSIEDVSFRPNEQKAIRTGLVIKIPDNHVGLIRDRAGIVSEMNLHTVAGTFDPGYRGEVSVVLVNFSEEEVLIEKGMKIAQLLIIPILKVNVKEVKELDETERGDKGFKKVK
ncbi:MAG: dUTP diphosphatase [Candidatus Pacearchaeota archaeon]